MNNILWLKIYKKFLTIKESSVSLSLTTTNPFSLSVHPAVKKHNFSDFNNTKNKQQPGINLILSSLCILQFSVEVVRHKFLHMEIMFSLGPVLLQAQLAGGIFHLCLLAEVVQEPVPKAHWI